MLPLAAKKRETICNYWKLCFCSLKEQNKEKLHYCEKRKKKKEIKSSYFSQCALGKLSEQENLSTNQ